MDPLEITRELGPRMYRIEKEEEKVEGLHDPVFEIVRLRGGAVTEDDVGKFRMNDPGVNSKDPDFLKWVAELGLEKQLEVLVDEEYGSPD